MNKHILACCIGLLASQIVLAANSIEVPMYMVAQVGFGKQIGTVTLKDTKYGLLIVPNLKSLSPAPGTRGLHVHDSPNCDNFGMAAQGYFDPEKKNKHLGPYDDNGMLGDLPSLSIDSNGTATIPLLAPRLTTKIVQGHSLVIHMSQVSSTDDSKVLDGSDRYACGIIPILPSTQVDGNSSSSTTAPSDTSTNKYGIDVESSEVVPTNNNTAAPGTTPTGNNASSANSQSTAPGTSTNPTSSVPASATPTTPSSPTTPAATPSTSTATPSTSTATPAPPASTTTPSLPATTPANPTNKNLSTLTSDEAQALLKRKQELQQMQQDNLKQLNQLSNSASSVNKQQFVPLPPESVARLKG